MRSRVNSRNSRRRCRRCCRLRVAPLLSDKSRLPARDRYVVNVPRVLSMPTARLACKSSTRRDIDRQQAPFDFLASSCLVVAARANSHTRTLFFFYEKTRSSLLKRENLLSPVYSRVASLMQSFNHLSLNRADAKITVVRGAY